jgi:hypothetical protein
MISLNNGDAVRALASITNVITYSVSGYKGTNVINADGLVTSSEVDIYLTDTNNTAITEIVFRNTDSSVRTITLYRKIAGGTSRALLSYSLGVGYSLFTDGRDSYVYDTNGALQLVPSVPFDATAPSTQAIGDTASIGTAITAPRRDHKHAMPSQATMDSASVAAVNAAGVVLADAKGIEYTTPSVSHTASGKFKTKTAGTSLVFGDACYMGTDSKMEKALADDAAITIPATHLCIATIAENAAGLFLEDGEAHDDSWSFDVGTSVYLSQTTAGLVTKTMPTKVTGNQVQVLGTAIAADTIQWHPSPIIAEYA